MADDRDDIRRYLNNEMTASERHAFEKKALSDPFLAEALEGSETLTPSDFEKDVKALSHKISKRPSLPQALSFRIAAGVALLCVAGWLIFRGSPSGPQPLAEHMKDSSASQKDSIRPALTLAQPEAKTAAEEKPKASSDTHPARTAPSLTAPADQAATAEPTRAEAAASTAAEDAGPSEKETRAEVADQDLVKAETAAATKGAAVPQSITLNATERKAMAKKDAQSEVASPSPAVASSGDAGSIPASPIGGVPAFRQYLESNRQIPKEALKAKVHGVATVDFSVSPTGEPGAFTVVTSLGFGCEQELIRLIQSGPKWTPAHRNGKPEVSIVRVSLDF
jgi:hypothetical protein